MSEALAGFRLTDAIDIAIVAAGIYAGLTWLRRSQAGLVALGCAGLASLYAAAGALELGLTRVVLQGFFAAGTLGLVVIFQEELRQAFEELAAWALGRRDDHRPRLDAAEILGRSLVHLAREKIGALVVIPGIQKLGRHVHGGVQLGGELSAPLLESLFDQHSAGHDGAVVVEDRRVSRFGAQLPLSRNVAQLAETGTRHSAALGLSERTDALCLVVSEERGTISAARGGQLAPVSSPEQLASILNRFYRHRRGLAAQRPRLVRVLRERRSEKAAALLLACVLWLLMALHDRGGAAPESAPEGPPVAASEKR